ncbi:MAG: hypothetical protein QOI11_2164 [Candidatus Eremiobacteraeota bacterium]|jgi:hypothetical protein|nr:hypothetical protein [Candidatus Eremiobacteraeota bacterium]
MTARLRLLAGAVAALAVFVLFGLRADATVLYASKILSITVTVTPSPVAFVSPQRAVHVATAHRQLARAVPRSGAPQIVAQVTSAQGSVKVNATTKADPTSAYLKITPNHLTLPASYGTNTYTCAFRINAFFPKAWSLTDWVLGSSRGAAGTFPAFDYPATSDLAWWLQGVSTSFTPYANQGAPGETPYNNLAANVSKTFCFDLQLTVPNTVAAGTYSTNIQYNLYVTP